MDFSLSKMPTNVAQSKIEILLHDISAGHLQIPTTSKL